MRCLALLLVLGAVSLQPSAAIFDTFRKKFDTIQARVQQHRQKMQDDVAAIEASSGSVIYTADADPLGKAATHVPQLRITHEGIARTASISVAGMEAGRWVDALWVRDQNGKVLHLKRFPEDPGTAHPGS